MLINQITVFVENKPDRLASIVALFKKNNINISALSIADTSEFGILRLIADNNEKAVGVLKENGVIAKITKVVKVEMANAPGALSGILDKLSENHISIEYMYAFAGCNPDSADMVVKTDDLEKTEQVLG